ncbi:LuxR C-terminal-related transcriptional regulator [Lentzea sp. BCCO 10_0856]|uniref:LuxR C-terminal-related transcriptional regulator n=1 Tax=Lentzea miocenica TaxID=3095431 RepID=A0ABU4SSE4_9PSEU|nr:LuxR C-terminal-related transcriptional regulator [Lentzea sp. BCCO 10_0856]MDX8028820.1 LuxR C-terminal-related transcriptional regulator [Lentzea sp. BCCO 10_0856]
MTCEDCGAPLTAPAKYCSGACRQRAYRRRAREVVHTSPRLDTFVGRHAELAGLTKLLARHRIVTVVGPPGVGKSRFVQEAVAHRQHAMVVELADVTRVPDLLATAPNPGLLVLDGCEHVLGDCAELVARHPALRVLATSRELLNVPGEQAYRLSPLGPHEARRLFRDRALAFDSEFDESADLLDAVCERLDRLPLALELAARLIRVLTLEEIEARLDNRFAVLTAGPRDASPHHRSLHAAIDHSYQLLTEAEKTALQTFAMFPDGMTEELADALVPDGWEIAKRLKERSLLENGERLTMLESVRLFALPQGSVNLTARQEERDEPELRPLSWRDERLLQVAAMVAEGLTNRQIADGLHVSLRTVEADVRDLKTVLGVRSRAQIAAWTTQS